jgi:hypothetical protein
MGEGDDVCRFAVTLTQKGSQVEDPLSSVMAHLEIVAYAIDDEQNASSSSYLPALDSTPESAARADDAAPLTVHNISDQREGLPRRYAPSTRRAARDPNDADSGVGCRHRGVALPDERMNIMRAVNRDDLRHALEREGVRPTAYDLNPGRLSDDAYCLAIVPGGWSVWFAERGERREEVFFQTEDEACAELLLRVVSDPTTRRY